MTTVACPPLETILRRASARTRRRRFAVWAFGGTIAASSLVIVLEVARAMLGFVRETGFGHEAIVLTGAGIGLAAVVVAFVAAARGPDEESTARDLDRDLGLADLAATTLALVRGRVASPLAPHVVAQAVPALDAAAPRVDLEFAEGAGDARLFRRAVLLTLLACVLVAGFAVLDWFRGLGWPFGLSHGPRDVGVIAQDDPSSDRPVPAKRPGAPGGDAATPPAATRDDPASKDDAPRPDEPKPEDAAEPDLRVRARPARDKFGAEGPVLVVVSAVPTRDLPRDRTLALSIELDGHEVQTGSELRVARSQPEGAAGIQDLRRIPKLSDRVGPGEHTVRARLRDAADGTSYMSEPAKFRVEGDGAGGASGGQGPQDDPKPEQQQSPPEQQQPEPQQKPPDPEPQRPEPEPKAPPAPDEHAPPDPPQGAAPPSPQIPVKLDPQVVVPLFGEGEEVTKRGPTIVLVPGGRAQAPTRRADLAEALPDAARRAEQAVDRGGVRAEDRDLVKRYFEALLRALR